jgi:5'-deoxy-5'-methylthioadenosine phosphorylase
MGSLAVIGGTGLTQLDGLAITDEVKVETPFGEPSSALLIGDYHGKALIFLPRHGPGHRIPPHKINYRANIWALQQYGVEQIVAVAAVGGIAENMAPGMLATPDQVIDYTYGREHSFFSDDFSGEKHIDFTYPYDQALRERIKGSATQNNIALLDGGTYGAVQGPRLETAAEIRRMKQDGCTMVGMTGMPEASLARELALPYATIALSANWAAGLSSDNITMAQIEQTVADCIENIKQVLVGVIETQ